MALLLAICAAVPSPLLAQTAPAARAQPLAFSPADFAKYQPKTVYDMLVQIPGFTLLQPSNDRGLGQASENVVVNGERVTDKSGAVAKMQNTPASEVVRIEIVPGATLGIAGLTSGQVANVILKAETKGVGNYEWKPTLRSYYALPSMLRGSVNYSNALGDLAYTLSLRNNGGRGAIGGDAYVITDAAGAVTERRDQVVHNEFNDVRLSGEFKYGAKGPVRANLTLVFDPYFNNFNNFQRRYANGDPSNWRAKQKIWGYVGSGAGDVAFNLGPGELKFLGVDSYEHAPSTAIQTDDYDSGATSTGSFFGRDSRISETIGRVEYHWKAGPDDWRFSLERAYNKLDQRSTSGDLTPAGTFDNAPYAQGTGVVAEERYEGLASLSRPLGGGVNMQMVGGAEHSVLRRRDRIDPPREFLRPKGSLSLAWRPAKNWDLNLKFERRVGQISFYDFLGQQDLVLARSSDANPQLVPPQSWELTGEIGREFGRWGRTRLKIYDDQVEDIVDDIPVGADSDAVGTLPHASRLGFESKTTIQFDPIGWKGAKVDATFGAEDSHVRDPLTGQLRPISNVHDRWVSVELRDDIPGNRWAWGGSVSLDHFGWGYYVGEQDRGWEGPYAALFIENKSIKGLDIRLDVFNVNDGRSIFDRVVYSGRRSFTPVSFEEHYRQVVGPIYTLTFRGTF